MDILIIDSESLADPLWINSLSQLHVSIEFEPNSEASKYHHVYYINNPNNEAIKTLQKQLKHGWYAFRIQSDRYTILFNDALFEITQIENNKTESYLLAQKHGQTHGIQEEYLNFQSFIVRYTKQIRIFKTSSIS